MTDNMIIVKDFICSICHENMLDDLRSTKCGHMFHPNCIMQWLKVKDSCPLCNTCTNIDDLRAHPTLNSSFQPLIKTNKEELCKACDKQICGKALKTRCSHQFHPECLNQFLSTRDLCPKCRIAFVRDTVIEIHLNKKEVDGTEKLYNDSKKIVFLNRMFKHKLDKDIQIHMEEMQYFKLETKEYQIQLIAELGLSRDFIDKDCFCSEINAYKNYYFEKEKTSPKNERFREINSNINTNLLTPITEFPIINNNLITFYESLRNTKILGIKPPMSIDKDLPVLGPYRVDKPFGNLKENNSLDFLFGMTTKLEVYEKDVNSMESYYEGQLKDSLLNGWGRKYHVSYINTSSMKPEVKKALTQPFNTNNISQTLKFSNNQQPKKSYTLKNEDKSLCIEQDHSNPTFWNTFNTQQNEAVFDKKDNELTDLSSRVIKINNFINNDKNELKINIIQQIKSKKANSNLDKLKKESSFLPPINTEKNYFCKNYFSGNCQNNGNDIFDNDFEAELNSESNNQNIALPEENKVDLRNTATFEKKKDYQIKSSSSNISLSHCFIKNNENDLFNVNNNEKVKKSNSMLFGNNMDLRKDDKCLFEGLNCDNNLFMGINELQKFDNKIHENPVYFDNLVYNSKNEQHTNNVLSLNDEREVFSQNEDDEQNQDLDYEESFEEEINQSYEEGKNNMITLQPNKIIQSNPIVESNKDMRPNITLNYENVDDNKDAIDEITQNNPFNLDKNLNINATNINPSLTNDNNNNTKNMAIIKNNPLQSKIVHEESNNVNKNDSEKQKNTIFSNLSGQKKTIVNQNIEQKNELLSENIPVQKSSFSIQEIDLIFEEGFFKHDKLHGFAVQYSQIDNFFIGNFENNKRKGFGILSQSNGKVTIGMFDNNQPDGCVKVYKKYKNNDLDKNSDCTLLLPELETKYQEPDQIRLADKEEIVTILNLNNYDIIYDGNMKSGKKNGQGKLKLDNGFIYYGYHKEDYLDGKGKVILDNGDVFYGSFEVDAFNDNFVKGYGEYYLSDFSKVFKGEFDSQRNLGKGIWYDLINKEQNLSRFEETISSCKNLHDKSNLFDQIETSFINNNEGKQIETFDMTVLLHGLMLLPNMHSDGYFDIIK